MTTNRAKMKACALLVGLCFGIGLPALFSDRWWTFTAAFLVSLPASCGVGFFQRRAADDRRASRGW